MEGVDDEEEEAQLQWRSGLARAAAGHVGVGRPWVAWSGVSCGRRRGPTACACRRECGCHEGRRHKRMCLYMRRIASSGCGYRCGILLGLLAKIKCSICSYQFNIWYTGHWLVDINLIFGIGELSQFTGGFRALAMDLHPSMAEASNHLTEIDRVTPTTPPHSPANTDQVLTARAR